MASDTSRDEVPAIDDAEAGLAAALDRYTDAIARGDLAVCAQLRTAHPQLSSFVSCLDVLDQMASLVRPLASPVSPDDIPTIVGDAAGVPLHFPLDDNFPREFGRYELLGELGRGGMGVVYQARHKDLRRIVALKMVRSQQLASAEELRRFQVEARAAARLKHPHIVAIHDVGQVGQQHFYTMDYVPGTTLAALISRGPVDPDMAAQCLARVAQAVHYLHAHGIVHRDLKPANILLDEQGRPWVTDFGLAKVHEHDSTQTQSGAILGTPSYMSPEQAAGRHRDVGPQSDIWSLGAILYEMLTGRKPFQEDTYVDTLLQVMEGEPTLPNRLNRAVPSELEWVCMKCLEKDPKRRYATAAELADDLERYTRREVTSARPSGFAGRFRRWARREPALVMRLVNLAAAALIVQLQFWRDPASLPNYWQLMAIFAVAATGGFGLQQLLHRPRTAEAARYIWSALDIVLYTLLLAVAREPLGLLLVGYPFFIAASGLLFRVPLVAFTTAASIVSYSLLLWLLPDEKHPPHYVAVYFTVLILLGGVIGIQVHRVRALSRFYDRPISL